MTQHQNTPSSLSSSPSSTVSPLSAAPILAGTAFGDAVMSRIEGTNAIVLTNGLLHTGSAKTAHGLIRGTERFAIRGIIDSVNARAGAGATDAGAADAGLVLDGIARGIPVYASVEAAFEALKQQGISIQYCIVGLALAGGKLPEDLTQSLQTAIRLGMNIVNGLHDFLSDMPEFATLAQQHNVALMDIRRPKKATEMEYWSGRIMRVTTPRIAVLGTDCALGKRTTARFLVEASRKAGLSAEMIYTGQTGWMQGNRYGFVFDSTLNDFITGELETAIVRCFDEAKPDLMFLEGQSSLRNPVGPAGSEFLVSGRAKFVVLQHSPARRCFKGTEEFDLQIPSVRSEIDLIAAYGAETLALTLNTKGMTDDDARAARDRFSAELAPLGIPVVMPLADGVDAVIARIKKRCLA
jgi:uncharacterized NAD-dependent epimerase/dehydratase family protein